MKVRKEKGVAIVTPSGWMMGGKETDDFEKTVRDLLEAGNRCLIVDLGDVKHMNSTALGVMIGLHTSFVNREGRMTLCNMDARINSIMVIAKLSMVFDSHESLKEAVESYSGSECPEV